MVLDISCLCTRKLHEQLSITNYNTQLNRVEWSSLGVCRLPHSHHLHTTSIIVTWSIKIARTEHAQHSCVNIANIAKRRCIMKYDCLSLFARYVSHDYRTQWRIKSGEDPFDTSCNWLMLNIKKVNWNQLLKLLNTNLLRTYIMLKRLLRCYESLICSF